MTYLIVIPGRLAGANDLTHGINRFAGGSLKKKETRRCAEAVIASGLPVMTRPLSISFTWYEPSKRRDLDNIRYGTKFILDGLRLAGRISNDGWAQVAVLGPDRFFVDNKNPRVEVLISEVS